MHYQQRGKCTVAPQEGERCNTRSGEMGIQRTTGRGWVKVQCTIGMYRDAVQRIYGNGVSVPL